MLLSIDPGVHHHGCALWENGELAYAWMTKKDASLRAEVEKQISLEALSHIAIECMQIYADTGVAKGNDLLAVNFSGGRAVGEFGSDVDLTIYRPGGWKGSVPKGIMVNRIIKRLDTFEIDNVDLPTAKSKQHNVWDGVGIGLKYWGRL